VQAFAKSTYSALATFPARKYSSHSRFLENKRHDVHCSLRNTRAHRGCGPRSPASLAPVPPAARAWRGPRPYGHTQGGFRFPERDHHYQDSRFGILVVVEHAFILPGDARGWDNMVWCARVE